MVDRWFFDDDILGLEARTLVKEASRAAHSQSVHDCKTLLLSDNLCASLVDGPWISGCWSRSDALALVCLGRNIKISVRWIPSVFKSSDRGSREHDNAHDATNSVADHVGSRDGQALAGAHTGSGGDHSHCEAETLATSDGVPFDRDLLPGTLKPWQKKREDSVRLELGGDRTE